MSGDWTDDYMRWKVETLALQHSHKESQQTTGLWGQYGQGEGQAGVTILFWPKNICPIFPSKRPAKICPLGCKQP